jgi:threonine/homoserine efflux transporter RhtA
LSLLPVPIIGITSGVIILGESVGWQEGAALALITMALASTLTLPSLAALKKR